VASNYPTSVHWIIRFEDNAEVFTQAAIEVKNSSRVYKSTLVNWSALPEKTIDNALKDDTASDCRHVC